MSPRQERLRIGPDALQVPSSLSDPHGCRVKEGRAPRAAHLSVAGSWEHRAAAAAVVAATTAAQAILLASQRIVCMLAPRDTRPEEEEEAAADVGEEGEVEEGDAEERL